MLQLHTRKREHVMSVGKHAFQNCFRCDNSVISSKPVKRPYNGFV